MKSPAEIRKSFAWGIPLFIFIMALSIWNTKHSFSKTITDLKNLSPAIKITPGDPVVAYGSIILTIIFTALILHAIPCKTSILKIAERAVNISIIMGFAIMLTCLFVITPLQYYAMPKLGYTRCNILEGHPNMYFTDWVKNPDWCVRGKSREWVKEQARMASESPP